MMPAMVAAFRRWRRDRLRRGGCEGRFPEAQPAGCARALSVMVRAGLVNALVFSALRFVPPGRASVVAYTREPLTLLIAALCLGGSRRGVSAKRRARYPARAVGARSSDCGSSSASHVAYRRGDDGHHHRAHPSPLAATAPS
jgi:hypothetical protein